MPKPQERVVYRVRLHDGTPLWPGPDDEGAGEADEIVYRITLWDSSELSELGTVALVAGRV